jgi:hypothetical protein
VLVGPETHKGCTTTTTKEKKMRKFRITFENGKFEDISANYWIAENGWVTFKSETHKQSASYRQDQLVAILLLTSWE